MRILAKAVLTAAVTATLTAAMATPAAAFPDPCPNGEDICVYLSESIPVANPVTAGPSSAGGYYHRLPKICDSSGTDCTEVWVGIPRVYAESAGGTIGTLDIPGTGIGIDSSTGGGTLYVTTLPTFTWGTGPGIQTSVTLHDFPVLVIRDGIAYECALPSTSTIGPVTVAQGGCETTTTVTL